MDIKWEILIIILGCALVTFPLRVVPIVFLSRIQLPSWLIHWLQHIPVAVMSALLAQELFLYDGKLSLTHNLPDLLAALPTFLVAILTRSLLGAVVVGILTMMLLRTFLS